MKKDVRPGDIITVKLDESTFAYGQFVTGEGIGCYIFFDVISNNLLPINKLDMSKIYLLSYCVDQRIQNGEWKIIGNTTIKTDVYIPEFKADTFKNGKFVTLVVDLQGNELRITNYMEKIELDYAWSVTPNVIESALKYKIGKAEWYYGYNKMLY